MSAKPRTRLQILPDRDSLCRAAADLFIASAREHTREPSGTFAVALSGGSTPAPVYRLLGSEPYSSRVEWGNVHIFWVDERMVPKDHPESNFKLVFDLLLSKVPIPDRNVHRIPGEKNPDDASREYESDLHNFFDSRLPAFDLIILGIGKDGHTASLFPGSMALNERARFAVPVHVGTGNISRVTLTLPVLNNAENVLFLASGPEKAEIIARIFGKASTKEQYPAGLVNPAQGSIIWLIDKDAAQKLDSIDHGV